MDRNEYNFKIEEMRVAVRNKDYERAVQIADSLDYRREKANDILSLIADAYEMAKQYDKAKQALIIAYENTNTGRHLAYRLCLLSAKLQQFDEAEEFYQDFVELAPRDNDKYILQYEMQKAKKAPIGKLIEILEKYIQEDMEEKWAYELAKLYHEAGDEEGCVDMCDEISLWFAEGKYVNKAMELKKLYRPLTKLQQERYDNYRLGRKPLQKIEKDERKENKQAGDIEDNLSIDNAISEDKEKESVSVKIADEVIDERPSIPFMIRKDNFKESIRKLKHPVIESIHKSNDEKKAEGESEQKELFAQQNNPDVQEIFVEQNDPEMHEITFEDEFEKDELELESEENSESEENPEVNKNLESEENLESKENEFIVDEANIEESSKEKSDYSAKEATDESDGKLDVEKIAVESDSTENNVDKEAETILDGKENVDAIQENDSDEKSLSEEDNASNNESITDDEEDQIVKKQNTGQLSIEEVLHKLQDRGILKADTVEKAVKALDEAENIVEKTEEDFEKINPDYKRIQSIHEGLGIDEEGNEQEIEDTETYNYDNEQYFDEIEISNQGKEIQHAGVSEFENPTHDKELGADHEKELDMVQRGLESFAAEAAADVFVPDVDTDVIEEEIKFQTGEISFGTMDLNEIVNQSAAPERHNEKRINVSSNDISDTVQLEKHTSSIPNMDNEMTEITLDPIDFEKTDNIEKSPETNEIPNFDIEALEDTETAGETKATPNTDMDTLGNEEAVGETKVIPNIDIEALEDEEVAGETKAIPNIDIEALEDEEVTGETKATPNTDMDTLGNEEVAGETKAIPNIEEELEKAAESEQTNVPTLDLEFDMPEIISGTDDSVLGNQLPEEDLVNYDIEETIQYEKEELEELNNIIDSERMMNIEGEPEKLPEYEEPEVVTEKLPKKRLSELSADLEEIFNNDIIDFRDMPAEELERERRESILISDIDKTMELERPKSISDLVKEAEENIISEEPELLDEPLEETVGESESDTIDEDAVESTEPEMKSLGKTENKPVDELENESTEEFEINSTDESENEYAETIEDYETIDDVEEVEDSEDEPIEDIEESEDESAEDFEEPKEDLVEEELQEDSSENLTKDEPEETKKSEMENVEMLEVSAEMDKIAQEIESMPEISIPELDIPKIEIPNLDLPDLSDEDALELSDLTDVADSKEDSEAKEDSESVDGMDDNDEVEDSKLKGSLDKSEDYVESEPEEVEPAEQESESTEEVEPAEQESDAVEEGKGSEQETEQKSAEKESETKEEKDNSGTKIVTDEDMKVFANYTNIEGLDDTIKYTIEKLVKEFVPDGNSSNGNIAISGDEKSGKTTLAIDIIKMVNAKRGRAGRRIAKVNAEVLNRRGFTAALNKLMGSDLIVEKATDLNSEQIDEIIKSAKLYTNDMLIVLEGETDAMADMFDENEELKQIFDYPILIKTYNVKEWVAYGVQYAKDNGFNINEMGMLALFKAIDDWYGTKKEISQKDVEQILDAAIKRAKHKLGRKIVGIFKAKDKDDLQILKEADFNIK
ncbi:hypothetical protein DWW96_00905 [Eubacterium sp. AF17-7]|uniref:tetratricopeptide repeat protein n=1 Tax=Eubacterium sp. AF17-7 TaxID=2293105 RepID=UPI000E4F5B6A|nr:hypothetical protein [Eubacterium sp. AF17-7]RGG67255.1 hypothetical protein DWW96_00905 [Eubacterium sp. AF17-7]